jgi:hypothetical protein
MMADLTTFGTLANSISEQRNGAEPTIPAHIEMYDKLEPDVRAYAAVCAALHHELILYDTRHSAEHDQTNKTLQNVDNEAMRADLLLKQIAVARRLRSMNGQQRFTAWEQDMQPLLDQEKGLD